tara:strand:- start:5664 stop:6062 length:399 start_codon:yes stop_codon:yes gene_type:complete
MSVYKICFDNNIYVGSTINSLKKRKYGHTRGLKNLNSTKKLYRYIIDNNINHFDLELIEKINDIEQLKIREEHYRKLLNANLNTYRCHITPEERLISKNRLYTCMCGSNVRFDNRNRHIRGAKHQKIISQII